MMFAQMIDKLVAIAAPFNPQTLIKKMLREIAMLALIMFIPSFSFVIPKVLYSKPFGPAMFEKRNPKSNILKAKVPEEYASPNNRIKISLE